MKHYDFKVTTSKRLATIFFIFLCFLGFIAIQAILIRDFVQRGVAIILGILYIAYYIVRSIQYRIEVKDSTILIRQAWGKKQAFHISDVEQVFCKYKDNRKNGTSYSVYLVIKSNSFLVQSSMDGFQKMAEYLVDKYENGEMKKSAMTKEWIELLRSSANKIQK